MGWTGTELTHSRPVSAEEAIRAELGSEFMARVIAHVRKPESSGDGHVVYAAVRAHNDPTTVFALVLLAKTGKSTSFYSGRELWTKAMDDTMGPAEDDCPAQILDLLSPTESEYAIEWRGRCRERIAKQAARPKVAKGTRVKFASPMQFSNGDTLDTFQYIKGSQFNSVVDGRVSGLVYSISKWRTRSYEVIA